jgi:hypothetical protein
MSGSEIQESLQLIVGWLKATQMRVQREAGDLGKAELLGHAAVPARFRDVQVEGEVGIEPARGLERVRRFLHGLEVLNQDPLDIR